MGDVVPLDQCVPIDRQSLTPAPSANAAENCEMIKFKMAVVTYRKEESCPSRQATQGPKHTFAAAKAAGAYYIHGVRGESTALTVQKAVLHVVLGREDAVLEVKWLSCVCVSVVYCSRQKDYIINSKKAPNMYM